MAISVAPGKESTYSELLTIAVDYAVAARLETDESIRPIAGMIAWKTCLDMIDDREEIIRTILGLVRHLS